MPARVHRLDREGASIRPREEPASRLTTVVSSGAPKCLHGERWHLHSRTPNINLRTHASNVRRSLDDAHA